MNQSSRKHCIISFILIILLVIFDQYTKYLAVKYLADTDGIALIKGVLKLQYLENTGAAFSILEGKMIVFYFITLVIGGGIVYFMIHMPKNNRFIVLFYTFAVLLAGALGNLIDRVLHHYVVDFIYFSLINFPVFNVADIYVTVCVVFIVYLILFYFSDDELGAVFSFKGKK